MNTNESSSAISAAQNPSHRHQRWLRALSAVTILQASGLLLFYFAYARMSNAIDDLRHEADAARTVTEGLREAVIQQLPQCQSLKALAAAQGGEFWLHPLPSRDYEGAPLGLGRPANIKAADEKHTLRCNAYAIRITMPDMAPQELEVAYHIDGGDVYVRPPDTELYIAAMKAPDWSGFFRLPPLAATSMPPVSIAPSPSSIFSR